MEGIFAEVSNFKCLGKDLAGQEEQFSVHRSPTETLEILETLVCAIPE